MKSLDRILKMAICLFIFSILSHQIFAQDINMGNRFQINKDGSYIIFKTTMGGFPVVRGSAKAYQATMFFDPENIMNTSATIRIGSESLLTAHDKRDTELHGEHFLNVAKFPGIWFQSNEVRPTESGFDLFGTMNIKNIIKPVIIQVETPAVMPKAMNNMDLMITKGKLKINRKDFELGTSGSWASNPMLGDEIEIEFSFMGFSYTLDYLKANFIRQVNGNDHAVGLVYNDVKTNGLQSGLKMAEALSKDKKYKADNWLNNYADIGWILMTDGLGKEGIAFFEKALKKDSKHLSSLLRLGDAYVIAGQKEKALAHYQKERNLPARARFTHLPEMIKLLSGNFELKNMK